jgi:capsular exopolysaccharide synthesis family protein
MTLHDYLRVLRERWIVILLAVLLCVSGAVSIYFLTPRTYTARLTMYVSSQGADTTQAAFQGAQLSQDRVASYTELLTSYRVIGDVINRLSLPETPDELTKKVTASSKIDSVLLDVTVSDPSPQRATLIANAVGDVFPGLVAELEQPTTGGASPVVAVRVVNPAQVPDTPSSTSIFVMIALGAIAGLALGVGGALARNAIDTSIKTPEHLSEAASGAPNLGVIAFDAHVTRRPLTVHEDPHSPRAEAFRQLRTNLQFVDVDNPRKVMVVTSSMPSEGKTTTAANLAIALASAGSRVLLVEADLRRPRTADILGLERSFGLTNVLSGRIAPVDAIQTWGTAFDFLASGPLPPNPSELLASRHMRLMLDELRQHYDLILIDTPPLLPVTDAAVVAPATDGVILACRYRETTRAQVAAATQALTAVSAPVLGTVFTMVPTSGPHKYARYSTYYGPDRTAGVAKFST